MSIFEDLLKSALGGGAAPEASQTENFVSAALEMLNSAGGVQGMIEKFKQSGLGDVVSSWVGTGTNQAISAEQLARVLGQEQISSLAQKAGLTASQGASALADVFPALIDKLTPDGVLPDKSQLMTIGKVILGGIGVAAAAKAAASVFGKKDDVPASAAAPAGAGTVTPPSASAASAETRTYTVVSGDSLSKIARQVYGDGNDWKRIFEANRDLLQDPDRIFPGQVLRIP